MSRCAVVARRETDYAWLAGFIDGEGCFTFALQRTGSFSPRINVGQKVRSVLECCKVIHEHSFISRASRTHDHYTWFVAGNEAVAKLLPKIMPFLKLKQRQASLMLMYVRSRLIESHPYTHEELELIVEILTDPTRSWRRESKVLRRARELLRGKL